jgi:biopolymer transport protein ExbD
MIHIEGPRRAAPRIGIAPLVDCMFLLLIFFLLTSSFSEREAVRIHLPTMATSAEVEKSGTVIAIERDGTLSIDGKQVAQRALPGALASAREESDRALIVADQAVPLSAVTDVLDAARKAGLTRVAIATKKPPDEEAPQGRREP